MGKLLPVLLVGLGTAVASSTGVWFISKGGSHDETKQTPAANKISSDLTFKDLDGFKSAKGGDCAQKYVSDFDYNSSANGTEEISSSFFPSDGDVQSCLVINGERTDSSSTSSPKGKGEFRWLGTLVKGTKGMVFFASYKPSSEDNKMSVERRIYAVEKSEGSSSGTMKKYSNADNSTKTLDSSSFDNSFPKKGDAITDTELSSGKDYGGFMSSTSDLNNICKSDDTATCPTTSSQEKTFKASGKGTSSSTATNTVDKWGKEMSTNVLSGLGDTTGGTWTGMFDSMKGTWTKEELKESPAVA